MAPPHHSLAALVSRFNVMQGRATFPPILDIDGTAKRGDETNVKRLQREASRHKPKGFWMKAYEYVKKRDEAVGASGEGSLINVWEERFARRGSRSVKHQGWRGVAPSNENFFVDTCFL